MRPRPRQVVPLLPFLLDGLFLSLIACECVEWLQIPALTQDAGGSRPDAFRGLCQDGDAGPAAVARVLQPQGCM